MKKRTTLGIVLVGLLGCSAYAQPAPPQDDGPREMRPRGPERMLNHLKSAMGVSDEQWKDLRPKLEEVLKDRHELAPMGGPPGMGMGGGRPPMRDGQQRGNANDPYNQRNSKPPAADKNDNADQLPPPQQDDHQGRPPRGNNGGDAPPPPPQDDQQGRPPRDSNGADGSPPQDRRPPHSELHDRFDDLQDALDKKDIKPEELQQKITAYQTARQQAVEKLTKSQSDLVKSLTPTQHAVLITAGVLD
jgi:hypothetical protein